MSLRVRVRRKESEEGVERLPAGLVRAWQRLCQLAGLNDRQKLEEMSLQTVRLRLRVPGGLPTVGSGIQLKVRLCVLSFVRREGRSESVSFGGVGSTDGSEAYDDGEEEEDEGCSLGLPPKMAGNALFTPSIASKMCH